MDFCGKVDKMKQKLTASFLIFSAVTFNRDLLQQLQVLLARLNEILTAQTQPRTTIIYRSVLVPEKSVIAATSTQTAVSLPEISGITPARGPVGTTIVIRGSGFTPTGNAVHTSYGTLPDLPSPDSETITLKVEPPGLPPNLGALKTVTFPELRYRFYIRNANGATKTPGEFVLDL